MAHDPNPGRERPTFADRATILGQCTAGLPLPAIAQPGTRHDPRQTATSRLRPGLSPYAPSARTLLPLLIGLLMSGVTTAAVQAMAPTMCGTLAPRFAGGRERP